MVCYLGDNYIPNNKVVTNLCWFQISRFSLSVGSTLLLFIINYNIITYVCVFVFFSSKEKGRETAGGGMIEDQGIKSYIHRDACAQPGTVASRGSYVFVVHICVVMQHCVYLYVFVSFFLYYMY